MTPVKKISQPETASIASFEVLVRKVKETFLLGRQRVRREMIRTYWQTGKYIHEHMLSHRERANYGDELISRLAERVDHSESSIRRILAIYRKFPRIPSSMTELELTHLYALASIPDKKMRDEFAKRAAEKKWNTRELRSKIKTEVRGDSSKSGVKPPGKPGSYSEIARPKLGTLYTYRLVRTVSGDALKIDQGFHIYRTEFDLPSKFRAGDIAESFKDKAGNYSAVKSKRAEEDLFTYKALVERVVDGDTLLVEIDLGFNNTTRQYLRLRVIDAPEIDSEAGRRAKEFVAAHLKKVPFIFLTTTRSDKYDRYLADVFIPGKDFLSRWVRGTAVLNASDGLMYLNNALLARRLAVHMP